MTSISEKRFYQIVFAGLVVVSLLILLFVLPEDSVWSLEGMSQRTRIGYIKDDRTGLCFARTFGGGLAMVPCDKVPKHLMNLIHKDECKNCRDKSEATSK